MVTEPGKEREYEKYAWIIFFALGILLFFPGVANLDVPSDYPAALPFLVISIATTVISIVGYRKAKKWSWYVLWYVPIASGFGSYVSYVEGIGSPWQAFQFLFSVLVLLLSLVGLFLPYRKFFPKKQMAAS